MRGELYVDSCIMGQNVGRTKHHGMQWNWYKRSISETPRVLFLHVIEAAFQHDNVRASSARETFLAKQYLPSPGLSSDLNPIEHMKDDIPSRCNATQPRPTTAAEFGVSLLMV